MSNEQFIFYSNNENITVYNLGKIRDLTKIKKIGSGNFGEVYLVEKKNYDGNGNNKLFALKVSKRYRYIKRNINEKENINSVNINENFNGNNNESEEKGKPREMNFIELRELTIMKALDHPNIINLIDFEISKEEREVWILMEYYPTTLLDYFSKHREINENLVKKISFQLFQGISYLHSEFIIHRDIKFENIFIDESNLNIVIGDMGLARRIPFEIELLALTDAGTYHYKPPEVILGLLEYSFAFDIWSLGCLIGTLVIGDFIFFAPDQDILSLVKSFYVIFGKFNEQMFPGFEQMPNHKIIKSLPEPVHKPLGIKNYIKKKVRCEFSEDFFDLMERMLTVDPIQRITAIECLEHPWFKDYCK